MLKMVAIFKNGILHQYSCLPILKMVAIFFKIGTVMLVWMVHQYLHLVLVHFWWLTYRHYLLPERCKPCGQVFPPNHATSHYNTSQVSPSIGWKVRPFFVPPTDLIPGQAGVLSSLKTRLPGTFSRSVGISLWPLSASLPPAPTTSLIWSRPCRLLPLPVHWGSGGRPTTARSHASQPDNWDKGQFFDSYLGRKIDNIEGNLVNTRRIPFYGPFPPKILVFSLFRLIFRLLLLHFFRKNWRKTSIFRVV